MTLKIYSKDNSIQTYGHQKKDCVGLADESRNEALSSSKLSDEEVQPAIGDADRELQKWREGLVGLDNIKNNYNSEKRYYLWREFLRKFWRHEVAM